MVKDVAQQLVTVFWGGAWLFSASMMTGLALRWWPGDQLILVRVFNYAMPWFMLLLAPLLLLAGISGRKGLLLVLLLPTLYILFSHLPLFLPRQAPRDVAGLRLKVMSYNVWSFTTDMPAVAEVIAGVNPDVLLLQEISQEKFHHIKQLLAKKYNKGEENFAYNAETTLGIFSVFPVTPMPLGFQRHVQKTLLRTSAGPVTVYNVHFLRTVWRRSHGWKQMHDEISTLIWHEIATISGPVIMGGDFNMTDQTQTYRMISKVLRNAHWEAGTGFGFTFPSTSRRIKKMLTLPPIVRIDHLFYNDYLQALSARTLERSGGSDHLPIVAELVVRDTLRETAKH